MSKSDKNIQNLILLDKQKIQILNFPHGYSLLLYILEVTQEKILRSFAKTNGKVISQIPGFLEEMTILSQFLAEKSLILNFPTGTTTHAH